MFTSGLFSFDEMIYLVAVSVINRFMLTVLDGDFLIQLVPRDSVSSQALLSQFSF